MSEKQELRLKRFQTKGFENARSVSIHCQEGSIWITAGNELGDRVIYAGKEIHLITTEKVVIEALQDSVTIVTLNGQTKDKAHAPLHAMTAENTTI